MSYDSDKFPYYEKMAFPAHLQPDEIVWVRPERTLVVGSETEGFVRTRGPLKVLEVADRPESTTPLILVQDTVSMKKGSFCASLLTRENPFSEGAIIAKVWCFGIPMTPDIFDGMSEDEWQFWHNFIHKSAALVSELEQKGEVPPWSAPEWLRINFRKALETYRGGDYIPIQQVKLLFIV